MGGEDEEELLPDAAGAGAISFRGKVSPTVAALLKRAHENLGPPNKELIRHLQLSGANPALIQGTYQQSTRARPARVVQPEVSFNFNEALALDILWLETFDSPGANIPALSTCS